MEPVRPTRTIYLKLAVLSLPLLVLVLFEGVLWLVPGLDADQYVDIGPLSFLNRVEIGGEPHYRVSHPSIFQDRVVTFAARKPDGTLRVFCLGGSAAASWPHPPRETWSAYLEQALASAYPDRRVEVINLAAHGFASYRVRHLLERVLEFDPDLVLVWTGNNEFLEERSYDTSGLAKLVRNFPVDLRTVRLARRSFKRAVLSGSELAGVKDVFWKKVKKEALALRADPEQFALVQSHFAESLAAMTRVARDHGTPLVLMTVPVNLRDWLPNVSAPVPESVATQWGEHYRQGRRALLNEDIDEAVASLREAGRIAPEHAETWYWTGKALQAAGDFDAALGAYVNACDQDRNPFRAVSSFNRSVELVGRGHGGDAGIIDLAGAFVAAAENGLPGFDLFLDYVHPTTEGNLVAARTAFDHLIDHEIPGPPSGVIEFTYRPVRYGNQTYDETLNLQLMTNMFGLFCLNHQYEAAVAKGREIDDLIRNRRALIQGVRGVPERAPDPVLEAIEIFSEWLEVEKMNLAGNPVPRKRVMDVRSAIDAYYAKYYPYGMY